jgi:Undecaprenyl-phosphate galactose phosphotransferase WbaP
MGVVLCLLTLAYWVCGLYSALGASPVLELRQIIQINTIGFLAAAIGGVLAPPLPWWCMGAWVLSVAAVPFCRATVRRWCCRASWWGHPTLVISSGKNADAVVLALLRAPTSGFRPVAVTDPRSECRSALMPVVNDPNALEALVRGKAIRYAVVCAPELTHATVGELFSRYGTLIPHLVVLSDVADLPTLWGTSRTCGRLNGVEMRNSRMLPRLWAVKRMIDVVVAFAALVFAMPLLVLIALAVKLTSRGPLFYGHSRIGYCGQWFMAWKFRTMHPNGDAVLAAHLNKNPKACEEWERDHKLKNDPRVTPIGKTLRSLSLDELPQLWNVLKGEMSLVGPRPIVATEVVKYANSFKKYSVVKPGITGMWQVSGRSETTYDERVRLDEYYVANWSPWLDIYILAKTVIILARRRGAY